MPLSQELPDFRHVPRGVDAAGRVTINARRFDASFIVSAGALVEAWRPRNLAELAVADLDALFELQPSVILLGTGPQHRFPATAVLGTALGRGIGLEAMTNAAAARTFAVLAGEGRRVVAAFLIDPADAG